MASEFKMCPPIWKPVKGSVTSTSSLLGFRMPFFRKGAISRSVRLCLATQDRKIHQKETRRNCTIVSVTGFLNAVKMALDDAFVMIEVVYQTPQSMTSFQLTGAFSDSAISCAFSLMLAFRPRTVFIASVKLFCLPCLVFPGAPLEYEFQVVAFDALLAAHRSLECIPCGSPFGNGFGDSSLEKSSNVSSASASCERSGNLYVPFGFGLMEERRRASSAVA